VHITFLLKISMQRYSFLLYLPNFFGKFFYVTRIFTDCTDFISALKFPPLFYLMSHRNHRNHRNGLLARSSGHAGCCFKSRFPERKEITERELLGRSLGRVI
jgi:hypothetical protein